MPRNISGKFTAHEDLASLDEKPTGGEQRGETQRSEPERRNPGSGSEPDR